MVQWVEELPGKCKDLCTLIVIMDIKSLVNPHSGHKIPLQFQH